MTLPAAPLPISFSDIQNELNGVNPISFSEYYRGGDYVSTALTSIPASGLIRTANFRGVTKQIVARSWYGGTMFGIYSSNSNADDTYFGGQMARDEAVYRQSNSYTEVVAPNFTQDPLYLTVASGWGTQLAAGYTWYDPGWFRSTRYYYDQISQPGLRVYRVDDGAYMGGVNGDVTVVDINSSWGIRYCNTELRIPVEPNKRYRIYYSVYMYRPSDIGYGDVSFGWSSLTRPDIYFRT
jgi:hypothetical protein